MLSSQEPSFEKSATTHKPARLLIKLLSLIATLLSLTTAAHAFECERVVEGHGPALSWFSRDIPYVIDAKGTRHIANDFEFATIRSAFRVWANLELSLEDAANCPIPADAIDLRFIERDPTGDEVAGYDKGYGASNENLLVFYDDEWPHEGDSADPSHPLALTTTTFNAATGEILDGDVEFNSAEARYFVFDAETEGGDTDLMSTAVHEIGHLLGLGHSSQTDATMFFSTGPGETWMRDLSCDDVTGILFKYPAGRKNGYCRGAVDSSCGHCAEPVIPSDATTNITLLPASGPLNGCHAQPQGRSSVLMMAIVLAAGRRRRWRRPTCPCAMVCSKSCTHTG